MLFEKLLSWVGPAIKRQDTKMRTSIGPGERLSLVVQHLASGDAQSSIASSYHISPSVVSRTITEVCAAIWEKLSTKGFLDSLVLKYWNSYMSSLKAVAS